MEQRVAGFQIADFPRGRELEQKFANGVFDCPSASALDADARRSRADCGDRLCRCSSGAGSRETLSPRAPCRGAAPPRNDLRSVCCVDSRAVLQHHDRFQPIADLWIGNADHHRGLDRRMPTECGFDFRKLNPMAAHLDLLDRHGRPARAFHRHADARDLQCGMRARCHSDRAGRCA